MSMLELPRELYLMICEYLKPTDLTQLARVSRDHYLAVQQPLFQHVSIYSYDKLVKLLSTVLRVPVVSHISPKQRIYWHKLSDAQLRERDVKSLQIRLDSSKETRIAGAVFERCIAGLVRKCENIDIHLRLYGIWHNGVQQLQLATLPNVHTLSIYGDAARLDPKNGESVPHPIWDIVFAGQTFPNLQDIYFNAIHGNENEVPLTPRAHLDVDLGDDYLILERRTSDRPIDPYHGLVRMRKITLEHNYLLSNEVLNSLFNSKIIPKRLSTLEIVNCPQLSFEKALPSLATLLGRGLQFLQHLKLHITRSHLDLHHATSYNGEIDEAPEHHLCNVVREFGKNIKSLDLALPFACNRMFTRNPDRTTKHHLQSLELPLIPQEPVETLPQRLIKQGYRWRSLRVYFGICRGAHEWDSMVELAADRGARISWDLVSEHDGRAAWCVGGYLPVESAWELEADLDESDSDSDSDPDA